MLQLINANAQVNLTDSAAQTLPAGFAQARSAAGETPPFDLHMAVQGFTAAEPEVPLTKEATAVKVTLSEADAEQWLASVLDQQAVRIEAREAPEQALHEPLSQDDSEQIEPAAGLPAELPGQAQIQPQPREPLPAQPSHSASASALSQQSLSPQVAAPIPQMAVEVAVQTAAPAVATEVIETSDLERLPSTSTDADKSIPASATSAAATTTPLMAERSLKLHAPQAQWGEQMLASLREQVDVQINQRIQNATIRLDPPELGSLEIFLSHESGRLSVQLSAANADVARLLQQTSERLRQELVGQNFVQVNVQVSADAQGGRQQQQAQAQRWLAEDEVAAAVALPAGGERNAGLSTSDVLVTV
ncbi:flagellar hook-length control protein FliK [Ectopseudomonas chengduensis]|nr:flagellar hook-length control protein FliK [Pseudomonas chengduensis]WKC39131.1 flagellar hook-length control protein FliK [Pseudomonas chengduensis]